MLLPVKVNEKDGWGLKIREVITFEIINGVEVGDDDGQVGVETGVDEHRMVSL